MRCWLAFHVVGVTKMRDVGEALHSGLQRTSTVVFMLESWAAWPEAIVGLSGLPG